jgi:hypothetical protein
MIRVWSPDVTIPLKNASSESRRNSRFRFRSLAAKNKAPATAGCVS